MNNPASTHGSLIRKICVYLTLYIVTIGLIASTLLAVPDNRIDFPVLRFIIIVFATVLLSKYFIYMCISPWYEVVLTLQRLKRQKTLGDTYTPRVSVLVPAWNEEKGIITTVHTLLNSTYTNLEIVIINNASTDRTERNIRKLVYRHFQSPNHRKSNIDILYCVEMMQGKGRALNKGLGVATGDIIMSIDADCSVPPDTISNLVTYFEDTEVMAAVGNVRIGNTTHVLGVIQYLEFLFSFYFKKADGLMNTIYIIGGAAGAYRREVFEKLGSYSLTTMTEDIELSIRIQSAGMKIVYAPDALVYTEGASTLGGLMKQRLRWKRGRFETFVAYKDMFFSTKKEHRKILTWFIFPLAIFGEIQLFFEVFFLIFLYIFSYLSHDYSSFISGIVVVSSMFVVQIVFDNHKETRLSFILLAPIGWLLFYVSTFVESQALMRALWGYARKTAPKWQQWDRRGVFAHTSLPPDGELRRLEKIDTF